MLKVGDFSRLGQVSVRTQHQTLEAFSNKLRDETDLEALPDGLVGVVAETM